MFNNLKKKCIFFNFFFKKKNYSGLKIKFNFSFLFFFLKDFYVFNKIFYFNYLFINYLFKIILILKILLLKKCNFLILIFLKKNNYKNNFFRKNYFLFYLSFFNIKLNKLFNSYKYLISWFIKKNLLYFPKKKFELVITLNFKFNDNSINLLNLNNIPIINFNSFFLKKEFSDFSIYYNSFFFFFFFFFFLKK